MKRFVVGAAEVPGSRLWRGPESFRAVPALAFATAALFAISASATATVPAIEPETNASAEDRIESAVARAASASARDGVIRDAPFSKPDAGRVASSSPHATVLSPLAPEDEPIVLAVRGDDGTTSRISIRLPVTGATAATLADGDALYEESNGETSFVVDAREDGVRILSILESPSADHSVNYELDLPAGTELILQNDGSVDIGREGEEEGSAVARIAAPWAKDNRGRSVSTWYGVEGSTLTQFIRPDDETMYPITADPYLGKALFVLWKRACDVRWSSGTCRYYSHSFQLSAWGEEVYRDGNAAAVLTSGWSEAKGKYSTVDRYQTTRDQFECHWLGHWGGDTGSFWDLEERRRATRTLATWIAYACNW